MSDLRDALKRSIAELEYCLDHAYSPDVTTIKRLKSIAALAQPEAVEPVALVWRDGAPPKPWADEWFIARTTFSDRVVLTALPEEYSYDFKTADDTYIKADRIKQWMQFPDSQFIAPPLAPDERMRRALEEVSVSTKETTIYHRGIGEVPATVLDQESIDRVVEALSRADEGKESDDLPAVRMANDWDKPSDPTPPDATAQREAIELKRLRSVAWAAQGLLNADTYVSDVPREQAVSCATVKLRQALGTWQAHHTASRAGG